VLRDLTQGYAGADAQVPTDGTRAALLWLQQALLFLVARERRRH
jgi:hypothetical protein